MRRVVLEVMAIGVMLGALWYSGPANQAELVKQTESVYGAGEPRSACWRKVRAEYIAEHPFCEACGTRTDIEIHHVIPFATRPDLECDPRNLVGLCRHDHFLIGHARDFHCYNPDVRLDAQEMRAALAAIQSKRLKNERVKP